MSRKLKNFGVCGALVLQGCNGISNSASVSPFVPPANYYGPASCEVVSSVQTRGVSTDFPYAPREVQVDGDFQFKHHMARLEKVDDAFGFEVSPFVVGGEAATSTASCQTDPQDNGASSFIQKNTVAILLRDAASGRLDWLCSGVVVANDLVITAAHCFDSVDHASVSPGYVVFGDNVNPSNLTNSIAIGCWQRNHNYISCSDRSAAPCVLNDIAWIRLNESLPEGYTAASIARNVADFTTSGVEKLFAGFGKINASTSNPNIGRRCVSTNGNTLYADGNGSSVPPMTDYLPEGGVDQFNSQTSAGAYQNYLTVVGPITGSHPSPTNVSNNSTSAKGVCEGDSGGPVFIKNGTHWVLGALTQGSNNILSPQPKETAPPYENFNTRVLADCQYGYGVFTTIGNYVDWIAASSGRSLTVVP